LRKALGGGSLERIRAPIRLFQTGQLRS
jgi:hypothetical protein